MKIIIVMIFILCQLVGCKQEKRISPPVKTQAPSLTQEPDPTPTEEPEPTQTPESVPTPTVTPKPEPVLLGSAQTKLLDKDANRLHNIRLAIQAVNGSTLAPGRVFSFNQKVGNRTPERGYKDATVLVEAEKQQGCGGGVCQLSTTVYQAAKKAGLTIIERNSHSNDVGYAAKDSDAAVNYGYLDMKFKNNTQYTVRIKTWIDGQAVYAELYRLQ